MRPYGVGETSRGYPWPLMMVSDPATLVTRLTTLLLLASCIFEAWAVWQVLSDLEMLTCGNHPLILSVVGRRFPALQWWKLEARAFQLEHLSERSCTRRKTSRYTKKRSRTCPEVSLLCSVVRSACTAHNGGRAVRQDIRFFLLRTRLKHHVWCRQA